MRERLLLKNIISRALLVPVPNRAFELIPKTWKKRERVPTFLMEQK